MQPCLGRRGQSEPGPADVTQPQRKTRRTQRKTRPSWLRKIIAADSPTHIQSLDTEVPYHTFYWKDRGISRIDHILHAPLPTHLRNTGNGCYTSDALLAATFDHRPVWIKVAISGTGPTLPKERHLKIPPRLNINPADHELVEFQKHLHAHLTSLPELHTNPHTAEQAAIKLALFHRITLDAAHDTRCAERSKKTSIHAKCQRKRSRFKDGFSAEMRESSKHHSTCSYTSKTKTLHQSWTPPPLGLGPLPIYSIIRKGISRWEHSAAELDRSSEDPDRPPTAIIRAATDPRQMLTWTAATVTGADFDNLRDSLTRRMIQGRARSEMRKRMTIRTHALQEQLELQNIGNVLQSIGLKRKQTPALTRLTLEDGATLTKYRTP